MVLPNDRTDPEVRRPDVPLDPTPPARARGISKENPDSPDRSPEPRAMEVESARLLANEARPTLGRDGYGDQRIDELADAFIAEHLGEGTEEFIRWARTQGPAGPQTDTVL